MKSTDHNLNNPTSVDLIPLARYVESWELPTVEHVTQEEYDLIKIKDPLKIYKITNVKNRVYYGNTLMHEHQIDSEYLIGIKSRPGAPNTYDYYIMLHTKKDGKDELFQICMFQDIQVAANAVILFNSIHTHEGVPIRVYNILMQYIQENISIHDFIIGIMCAFGVDHSNELHHAIQLGVSYGVKHGDRDLPILLRDELPNMRKNSNKWIHKLYADIYDIVVKYNFFKDEKYKSCTFDGMDKVIGDFYRLYL